MCIRDSHLSDTDRLALYQTHAGAPVKQIRYMEPMGWDRIDDQHVVLQMRPNESWLLRLTGPCLTSVSYTHLDVYKRQSPY